MDLPLANSTNILEFTLRDVDSGTAVTDATVSVSIYRPDTLTATTTGLAVPHIANGVYRVSLATTVLPISLQNYKAVWNITSGSKTLAPVTYFSVYGG